MPAPSLTTDEYLRMPETRLPQELVWGMVRDAPAPTPGHQRAVMDVYRTLWAHLDATRAGAVWASPIDVVLDREGGLIVQPDLVVLLRDRLHLVTDRIWGAPNLVVEVLSPHPRIGKREERLGWFAQYGVSECWLVQQLVRQIEIVTFERGAIDRRQVFGPDDALTSRVLPDLRTTPGAILSRWTP